MVSSINAVVAATQIINKKLSIENYVENVMPRIDLKKTKHMLSVFTLIIKSFDSRGFLLLKNLNFSQ